MSCPDDPTYWPPELLEVLVAIGRQMADDRLRPEIVEQAASGFESKSLGGRVQIRHGAKGSIDERYYIIDIDAHPLHGTWRFRSAVLEKLCRKAAAGTT